MYIHYLKKNQKKIRTKKNGDLPMIKCPSCGKGMPEDTVFCPHCGYMMSMEERENAQPYIEKQVTTPVNQPQQQVSNTSSSQGRRSYSSSNSRPATVDEGSVALGFFLGFLGVIGLFGLIFAIRSGKKKTIKGAGIGFGFFLGLAVIAGIIIGSKVL